MSEKQIPITMEKTELTGVSDGKGEKDLFILLSRTHTIPSKIIRFLNPMPYVHASIAFDENLSEMYSFARKRVHYPFYCGLIDEDINKGIYARKKSTECLVLRLPVTEEVYQKAHDYVESFKEHRRRYGYNYLGVLAVKFHRALERKYDYFCTQFVDKVLQVSGINLFGKVPGLVTPEDYRTSDKLEHFYEGLLRNYRLWLQGVDIEKDERAIRRQEKKERRERKRLLKKERKEQRSIRRLEMKLEKKSVQTAEKKQERFMENAEDFHTGFQTGYQSGYHNGFKDGFQTGVLAGRDTAGKNEAG